MAHLHLLHVVLGATPMLPPDAARQALRSLIRHLRRAEREIAAAHDLDAEEIPGWATVYEPELERMDVHLQVMTQAAEGELTRYRDDDDLSL
jgi:hypothetical protein